MEDKISELYNKQLKHVETIQLRIGGLSLNCPAEEMNFLAEALKHSVETLSIFYSMLPVEPDPEFEAEWKERKERHRKARERMDSKFKNL
jgi:hypothetical protein